MRLFIWLMNDGTVKPELTTTNLQRSQLSGLKICHILITQSVV
jgi:hypothetical protein